jgi:hypothetical protein
MVPLRLTGFTRLCMATVCSWAWRRMMFSDPECIIVYQPRVWSLTSPLKR